MTKPKLILKHFGGSVDRPILHDKQFFLVSFANCPGGCAARDAM